LFQLLKLKRLEQGLLEEAQKRERAVSKLQKELEQVLDDRNGQEEPKKALASLRAIKEALQELKDQVGRNQGIVKETSETICGAIANTQKREDEMAKRLLEEYGKVSSTLFKLFVSGVRLFFLCKACCSAENQL